MSLTKKKPHICAHCLYLKQSVQLNSCKSHTGGYRYGGKEALMQGRDKVPAFTAREHKASSDHQFRFS